MLLCLVRCILDGLSGGSKKKKKRRLNNPVCLEEPVVKWYTALEHKVCKYELSHESIAAFRARRWLC